MIENPLQQKIKKQSGFTLIELMVVVVIMAVVVVIGLLSVTRLGQDALQSEVAKLQGVLQQVKDESAFSQSLIIAVPDENGLKFYSHKSFQWIASKSLKPVQWSEKFTMTWQIDEGFISAASLPVTDEQAQQGWLFWPNGEVSTGELSLSLSVQDEQNAETQTVIVWNELLEFIEDE